MKTKKFFFLVSAVALGMAMAFSSCEGPEGPAGANGTDGTDGTNGTPGVDANSSCVVCHSQGHMDTVNTLYALSGHAAALYVGYAGGRAGCSPCHSNELFLNALAATPEVAAVDIAYPTAISCKTCHSNHSILEDGIDAPMTTVAAVTSVADPTVTFDAGSTSNLCMACHQARRSLEANAGTADKTYKRTFTGDDIAVYQAHGSVGPAGSKTLNGTSDTLTVVFDVPFATNWYISSTHAGPHHGPQADVSYGLSHAHSGLCVSCHMGSPSLTDGGHSWKPNVKACAKCHAGLTTFDRDGFITDFDTRMEAISDELESLGAVHVATDGTHPMYASLTIKQYEAFWNFMTLLEDKSHGIHNPSYAESLLGAAEKNLGL